ncbi:hypothetical protein C8035_v005050 [Colletotrichum spinosum]|uniref:Cardiolipin synthase N-terminal domain-containing protein n=1 Tax=Colletotrichum spinosum TaxID=1347390 RepID=A0A4R8QM18_9PEZI|nr:hypothetical protein C8035_v005050 [Colletotrichum spinosum]
MSPTRLLPAFAFQLCLAGLAAAAPIADPVVGGSGNAWKYGVTGGIFGLTVMILDVIVFFKVLRSTRSWRRKALWCLFVFFFPIIGVLLYWFLSSKEHKRPAVSR